MPRADLDAHEVTDSELPLLVDLCLAARAETGGTAQVCSPDRDRVTSQLRALCAEPGSKLVVATAAGEPVGLAISRVIPEGPFYEVGRLQIEALYVDARQRRMGAGHVMMARLAAIAADNDAPQVVCLPLTGSRSLQRFLARLGFAPAAGHRVTATDALQRRISAELTRASGRPLRRRGIDELIARRRKSRDTGEQEVVIDDLEHVDPRPYPAPIQPVTPAQGAAALAETDRTMQVRRAVASRLSSSSTNTTS